jgi:hypothetical protein
MPGINDNQSELNEIIKIKESCGFDMLQMRNLNLDPPLLGSAFNKEKHDLNAVKMISALKKEFGKNIMFGYYNPYFEKDN